uniref:Uncharacterized protein n=1 Tax=Opuntia streptacantha TaxID=393608 RepID=A0A7C8YUL1_OPUST
MIFVQNLASFPVDSLRPCIIPHTFENIFELVFCICFYILCFILLDCGLGIFLFGGLRVLLVFCLCPFPLFFIMVISGIIPLHVAVISIGCGPMYRVYSCPLVHGLFGFVCRIWIIDVFCLGFVEPKSSFWNLLTIRAEKN